MSMAYFQNRTKVAVVCDSCFYDITNENRIRCIVCKEDECSSCFLIAIKLKTHESHTLRVVIPSEHQKAGEKWSLINNYVFFEGLKLYGIGNWEDMSLIIPSMTEGDIEEHFIDIFSISVVPEKNAGYIPKSSNPNCHEIWCYMPLRQDFEVQFRDDFEKIMKDIKLDNEDGIDIEVKLHMFEIYKSILFIRRSRELFMIRHGLVNMRKLLEKEKRYDKTKLELLEIYKPLAALLSKNDFNAFLDGCFAEKKLKTVLDNRLYCLTRREMKLCMETGLSTALFKRIRRYAVKLMLKKKSLTSERLNRYLRHTKIDRTKVLSFFLHPDNT
eukprot:jgi/Antlo1/2010/323